MLYFFKAIRNEEEKYEPPKPQLQRKAKFGPFETSFEEEIPKNLSHFKVSNGIYLWNHL